MGTIRGMVLDQLEQTARDIGFDEAKIKAARAECERTNSDKPFRDLIMPGVGRMMKDIFNG
jgi:hypothetical protein